MVNHFKKVKAEGKLNPNSRAFGKHHDIKCDDDDIGAFVMSKLGLVFRKTDLISVAVSSIPMERYLHEKDYE